MSDNEKKAVLSIRRIISGSMLGLIGMTSLTHAEHALDQAITTDKAINQAAVQSQQKIDGLDDETRQMLDEYRQVVRELENLKAYNAHSRRIVTAQEEDIASIQQQIIDIEVTRQEIVPLMLKMQASLQQFVELDTPFLPEERSKRIARLDQLMTDANSSEAEKFRRLLEAFQVEKDYGYSIETYRDELELGGVKKPVDFLRLGRVALYYQTLDGADTGVWSNQGKNWVSLPDKFRKPIQEGIRIARKEAPPDLLMLPVPQPEKAQ